MKIVLKNYIYIKIAFKIKNFKFGTREKIVFSMNKNLY